MSMKTWKKNITNYFKEYKCEIISSLALLDYNTDSFEAYFENYLSARE